MACDQRFLLAGLALCVGLIAGWYGYRWWTVGRFIQITDDAYVGGEVTVIAPKLAGLIAEVPVTDNQDVRAGDLLVRLDDPTTEPLLPRRSALLPPKRQLSPISVPPAIFRNR
jgi:membrane fusion protein (multidrug efflux system)